MHPAGGTGGAPQLLSSFPQDWGNKGVEDGAGRHPVSGFAWCLPEGRAGLPQWAVI